MALDLDAAIGLRIKTLRQQRGLTQEELAVAIGRTVETVSNIERGRTSHKLTTLSAIAGQLDVPLPDLFDPAPPDSRRDRREVEFRARIADVIRRLRPADLEIALKQLEALQGRHTEHTE